MNIPTIQQAEELLAEASTINPGPWIKHSTYVAQAARLIAKNCSSMDKTTSYILGLLHDIGRRTETNGMRHVLDGYSYLMEKGYEDAARICMTHTFSYKDVHAIYGAWDCSEEELKTVENYISKVNYDDYDLLIQLCDSLSLPTGYTLLEKRFVETAIKSGANPLTVYKWKSVLEIKKYFERKVGSSIYSFLPNIVENTFGKL